MPAYQDQTGRKIILNSPPKRIISLVPSQTELLHDLGLDEEVIGITKFCIHPQSWFQSKQRVGGTKQLNIEIIRQLKPDLIIANKEENLKEQIEELEKDLPIWISDIRNLDEACYMIESVGQLINKQQEANSVITRIREKFSQLPNPRQRSRACYMIWRSPYMCVGGDTFINHMMEAAGFDNVFKNYTRYPEISIEEIKKANPDFILLSSEPFPFKQKHADELGPQLPGSKIILVDGEMFSWYGSRLLKSPQYFLELRAKLLREGDQFNLQC